MEGEETLTVAQVAGILDRDSKTVRGYIMREELKATWTGSKYLIKRSDLNDFVKRKDQERK